MARRTPRPCGLKALKFRQRRFVRNVEAKSKRVGRKGTKAFFRVTGRENPRGEKAQESKGPDLT